MSAVVSQRQITVCWLGDSRAYWLAANPPVPAGPNDTIDITGGSRRVTRDDSLAEEIVAAGLASMDEAMASPQAHVITRWLGADLPDPEAHVEQFTPTGPGVLLLCSDGLWNYRPEAAELAAMAMPAALTRPLDAAADLAKFAIDSGGLDNITVVLIPFPPLPAVTPSRPPSSRSPPPRYARSRPVRKRSRCAAGGSPRPVALGPRRSRAGGTRRRCTVSPRPRAAARRSPRPIDTSQCHL